MKNLLDRTQERIRAIKNARAEKLNSLTVELETTYSAIESQRKRVTECAAAAELETYRQEQTKLKELQDNAKILEQWKRDLEVAPKVTEKESEDTIAALLAYENNLERSYKEAAGKILLEFKKLTDKHLEEAEAAERVLINWTNDIRPNYKSSSYINGSIQCEDGKFKSKNPVTIHPVAYGGWQHIPFIISFLSANAIKEIIVAAEEKENGT